MIKKQIEIINKLGMHTRAAAKFVNLATNFNCDITIQANNKVVNGKSIVEIMLLSANKGTKLTIITEGSDEKKAISQLEHLINGRFEEIE